MGCSAAVQRKRPDDTPVQLLSSEDTIREDYVYSEGSKATEDNDKFDAALGFNERACRRFALPSPRLSREVSGLREREDHDEYRVLRVSSLSGNVTLYVAGGKVKKPVQYDMARQCPRAHEQPQHCQRCPFCSGNEKMTPPNVISFDNTGHERGPGPCEENSWRVRVIPNIFPMLICPRYFYDISHLDALRNIPHSAVAAGVHANEKVRHDQEDPTCLQVDARGASEIIIESPVHNSLLALQTPECVELLFKAFRSRGKALASQLWVKQILYFKQYGPLSGGSLVHPHSQMVTLPLLPPPLVSRLSHHKALYQKHGRCPTCLACIDPFLDRGERPHRSSATGFLSSSQRVLRNPEALPEADNNPQASRLVHSTDCFVVSVPYSASSPYSMTVAPRRHMSHFTEIEDAEIQDLARVMTVLFQALYEGMDDPNYNVFIRSAPVGGRVQMDLAEVSQEELRSFCHWIMEIRPRFPADLGGFEIASGVRVVSGLPEDQAAELRTWVNERLGSGAIPVQPRVPTPPKVAAEAALPKAEKDSPELGPASMLRSISKMSTRRLSKGVNGARRESV